MSPVFCTNCFTTFVIVVLKAGKLNEAVDILLSLEKQTRAVSNLLYCDINNV